MTRMLNLATSLQARVAVALWTSSSCRVPQAMATLLALLWSLRLLAAALLSLLFGRVSEGRSP